MSYMQPISKKTGVLLFLGIFLFLCFVMWCTPYSSDDYEFAALKFDGLDSFLSYVLHYGNGRFLGNIFSVSLVQLPLLAILVKAFLITSLIFLIPSALHFHSTYSYLVTFILLLAINPVLFGQVYTWTSGFSNYIPPIYFALIIVNLVQHYRPGYHLLYKLIYFVLVVVLGVASQLFVEHSTITNIFLSLLFMAKAIKKQEENRALSCIWFVSAVIGAILMFSIPVVYYEEGNRAEAYRSLNLDSISALIFSCVRNALKLSNDYMGTNGLAVCIGAILTTYMTRKNRSDKFNRIFFALCSFSFVFLLFSNEMSVDSWQGDPAVVYHALCAIVVLLPFIVWFISAWTFEDTEFRNKILIILALAITSLLVFLVVSPTPTRVIYQSYILIVAALLLCLARFACHIKEPNTQYVKKMLCSIACILVLILGLVFLNCRNMAQMRETHISQEMEKGATSIEIFAIPYDYIFWDTAWCYKYYYYYEEPGDIQFITTDFGIWRDHHSDSA